VQGIVDNATDEERAVIIQRIKRQGANLRKIPYGKVEHSMHIQHLSCLRGCGRTSLLPQSPVPLIHSFSLHSRSLLFLCCLCPLPLPSPLLQHIIAKIEKLTGARWEEQAQQTPQSLSPGAAPAVPAADAAGPNNAFLTQTQNQPAAQ